MVKETGRIVAVDKDAVWVETIQRSTCNTCAAQKGCGQSLLSRMGVKPSYIRVLLDGRPAEKYQLNQRILIGIPDDTVVKGSLLAYLLPLIFMLVFAGVAHTYLLQEVVVLAFGIAGFALGALLIRWHANYYQNDIRYQPRILDAGLVDNNIGVGTLDFYEEK